MNSVIETQKALRQKKISSVELTTILLEKIKQQTSLNAFISVDETLALKYAALADKKLQHPDAPFLTGVPMAHKDIFCTKELPTTCGSKMLEHYQSPFDATIVTQLKAQHVVSLGKTNMDEFAMGSTNQTSYFGGVKNPWHQDYVAGGSSGGSAAAVAAGLVSFTTASDTGGSIRHPAAFCGLSGIKPTYGSISRFGMVAFASSLDQAGIMAKTAADLSCVLPFVINHDIKDATSVAHTLTIDDCKPKTLKGLKVGIPYALLDNTDASMQSAFDDALKVLQNLGVSLVEIKFDFHQAWVPCYYVIASAEASSNLARYDGVRFGHQCTINTDFKQSISQVRTSGFGLEVKRRILTGTHVLSAGYFDAYYLQALKVRRLIQQEFLNHFKEVDLILTPTTPSTAFKLTDNTPPVEMYLSDLLTVPANLAGLPAMSIPMGFKDKLPMGLQLMGNHFSEALLLQIAQLYQTHTPWHTREIEEN